MLWGGAHSRVPDQEELGIVPLKTISLKTCFDILHVYHRNFSLRDQI